MPHHTPKPLGSRAALAALVLISTAALGLSACSSAFGETNRPDSTADLASSSETSVASAADGYISDAEPVSIFDESLPAIANLDPELREAVRGAADAAADDGQELVITSGWRSAAYQQVLLDRATADYGSYEEARKWVSTPELSAHVTGEAVDIGPLDAQFWLMEHGAEFGLCQTFANERWHFELATEPGGTCPMQRSDAAG
ncbi:M15 family metallopeptidase [Herbiconiux liukaitaii]|uniref:M15 family metallopeptidase n=1 Tax=Herbiconiux liukaitaii TaxID=3342799 RepID=UPI0035B91052